MVNVCIIYEVLFNKSHALFIFVCLLCLFVVFRTTGLRLSDSRNGLRRNCPFFFRGGKSVPTARLLRHPGIEFSGVTARNTLSTARFFHHRRTASCIRQPVARYSKVRSIPPQQKNEYSQCGRRRKDTAGTISSSAFRKRVF